MLSNRVFTRNLQLSLQPAPAWTAILGFIGCSVLLILVGAGTILKLFFPLGAFIVGAILYSRVPVLYIGFNLWLCFLTPLVRRLADYQSSFTEPSPILLAPYLVLLVTLVTLYQHLPKIHRRGGLPFVLCFVGLFYGILLGLVQGSVVAVVKDSLEWLTPVLFSFYLFVNWQNYPFYRQNIQRVFIWGVLVMGVYGVFQYLVAPEWDRLWLIKTEMLSAGYPEPLGIRVWSTMNSPLVFAVTMMAGLIVLFNHQGIFTLVASAIGYLAFLLSLVRTAWLGWLVAIFTLFSSVKSKFQIRLILIFMVMAACVLYLTTIEPFSEVIYSRLDTFSDIENDGSGQDRLLAYKIFFDSPLMTLVGYGIGTVPKLLAWDSGILIIVFALGWIGVSLYLAGMLKLIFELFRFSKNSPDTFVNTAFSVVVSCLFMMPFGSVHKGIQGVIFWGFLGLGLAAKKYYCYQNISRLNQYPLNR